MSEPVNSTAASLPSNYYWTNSQNTNNASNQLDKDAFLSLLTASLQYQDPSEPMSTSEIVSQTTALSTIEQLSQVADSQAQSLIAQLNTSATTLVGRTVEYTNAQGQTAHGTVTAATLAYADGSEPALTIAGSAVPYSNVTSVIATETSKPSDNN
jgi:flagellar basal-body rod modification protein FlgD